MELPAVDGHVRERRRKRSTESLRVPAQHNWRSGWTSPKTQQQRLGRLPAQSTDAEHLILFGGAAGRGFIQQRLGREAIAKSPARPPFAAAHGARSRRTRRRPRGLARASLQDGIVCLFLQQQQLEPRLALQRELPVQQPHLISPNMGQVRTENRVFFFITDILIICRVYYGSGEHRFFGASSFMSLSDDGSSRPGSSAQPNGDSPGLDRFPMNIYSPRRRAQEVPRPTAGERSISDSNDMQITQAPPLGYDYGAFRSLRRKTSSIWSPHLRTDRRASRYSVWDPPSVTWSADTGILGKRNAQIVLFIVGFIFPFGKSISTQHSEPC